MLFRSDWISSLAGTPGETPHIGANGNWYIGAVDTGVKAGGVTSYNELTDKPTLNGDTIEGDMEIHSIPLSVIDNLFVKE